MEKMRVVGLVDNGFILETVGEKPCRCIVTNVDFHKTESSVQLSVAWQEKGKYTNGRRKKLLARTIVSILRGAVQRRKMLDNTHVKENHG